jgi:hypothetical protein
MFSVSSPRSVAKYSPAVKTVSHEFIAIMSSLTMELLYAMNGDNDSNRTWGDLFEAKDMCRISDLRDTYDWAQ